MASTNTFTPEEYMALVIGMAASLAGPGNTPTPLQIEMAKSNVDKRMRFRGAKVESREKVEGWCEKLKGRLDDDVLGGDICGSFWDKVKSAAQKTLGVSKKYGKYALPLVPAAVATPFAVKAYKQYQKAKADEKAAKASSEESPVVVEESDSTGAIQPGQLVDVTRSLVPLILSPFTSRMKVAPQPVMVVNQPAAPASAPQAEEAEAAGEDSGVERQALSRIHGAYQVEGPPSVTSDQYRAAIWKTALKGSRGKRPSAVQMFAAQQKINGQMARHGAVVAIPGARPGRVTR